MSQPMKEVRIGLVGVPSVGKTSFLHSLFGRVHAPTGALPTTMMPVILKEDDDVPSSQHTGEETSNYNNVLEQVTAKNKECLKLFQSHQFNNDTVIDMKQLQTTHFVARMLDMDVLMDKLKFTIVDHPGIMDSNVSVRNSVKKYLQESFEQYDIIVMITDIAHCFTSRDEADLLDMVLENIQQINRKSNQCSTHFILIINKMDSLEHSREEMSTMIENASRVLKQRAQHYQVEKNLQVSSSNQDSVLPCIVPYQAEYCLMFRALYYHQEDVFANQKLLLKMGVGHFGNQWDEKAALDNRKKQVQSIHLSAQQYQERMEQVGFLHFKKVLKQLLTPQIQVGILIKRFYELTHHEQKYQPEEFESMWFVCIDFLNDVCQITFKNQLDLSLLKKCQQDFMSCIVTALEDLKTSPLHTQAPDIMVRCCHRIVDQMLPQCPFVEDIVKTVRELVQKTQKALTDANAKWCLEGMKEFFRPKLTEKEFDRICDAVEQTYLDRLNIDRDKKNLWQAIEIVLNNIPVVDEHAISLCSDTYYLDKLKYLAVKFKSPVEFIRRWLLQYLQRKIRAAQEIVVANVPQQKIMEALDYIQVLYEFNNAQKVHPLYLKSLRKMAQSILGESSNVFIEQHIDGDFLLLEQDKGKEAEQVLVLQYYYSFITVPEEPASEVTQTEGSSQIAEYYKKFYQWKQQVTVNPIISIQEGKNEEKKSSVESIAKPEDSKLLAKQKKKFVPTISKNRKIPFPI